MLNEYYQNIGIKGFIERYGMANALKRGLFLKNPFHIVKDYEIKKVLWQKRAAKKIEKYLKYAKRVPKDIKYTGKDVEDPIWIYWNTGMENAPEIIKKCYESVLKYGKRQVIVLSEKNMGEYVQLPKTIEKKKKEGSISLAAYADLMRFSLLSYYGGIWIDATVYLTDYLSEEIFLICVIISFPRFTLINQAGYNTGLSNNPNVF